MSGKIYQDTKTIAMHRAARLIGGSTTFGDPIDTRGWDSAKIVLNVGYVGLNPTDGVSGAGTVSAILYENSDHTGGGNAAAGFIPVTGGNFGLISSGTLDNQVLVGAIECKNYKRYLALAIMNGKAATIGIAATIELGKGDSLPGGNTATFDLA